MKSSKIFKHIAFANQIPHVNKVRTGATSVITNAKVDAVASGKSFHLPQHEFQKAMYGGRHTIAVIPGDGLGPEMIGHVKRVFEALSVPVNYDMVTSPTTDEEALEHIALAINRNGVALKGNLETKPGHLSRNLILRNSFNLYAYLSHIYSFPGVPTRHKNIDIVVIRQNTEGEYSRLEHENRVGVVESLKVVTEKNSRQIAEFAFKYAQTHGRKKITAVHKANIMKLGDGLFLNTCADVARKYPNIEFNSMIVDNTCMQLVSRPQQFDVMVMPNLYGSIVGSVCAGLVGGAGLTAGANIGENVAIFEMGTRKTGRSLVGLNQANPIAMLLTGANLLDYINCADAATLLRDSIFKATGEQNLLTKDIGGTSTTSEVVDGILKNIADA